MMNVRINNIRPFRFCFQLLLLQSVLLMQVQYAAGEDKPVDKADHPVGENVSPGLTSVSVSAAQATNSPKDAGIESTKTEDSRSSSHMTAENAITTEEARHAVVGFETAMALLNGTPSALKGSERERTIKAYALLEKVAGLGHPIAQRMIAVAHLFGDAGLELNCHRARELLEPLAARGDSEAQLYMGFMHSFGLASLPPSKAKALVYYTFAAVGGNQLAQMALGYRYMAGVGVAQSCESALDHYRRVAQSVEQQQSGSSSSSSHNGSGGSSPVQSGAPAPTATIALAKVRLSDEYENPSRPSSNQLDDDLIQYYQFLADKGDVQAQVGLGHLHYQGGRGVQQDHIRALNYFTQAANTGNANAMAFLGKMFLEGGKAVSQNNETAFKYFSMAAEKGNAVGQAGLGTMYLYGKGVPKDHERALRYLTMAANQGLVDGQLELGNMFYHGLGVEKNYKVALKYYQQASTHGHVLAFYHLGMMNARGIGTPRSCHNAVHLFKVINKYNISLNFQLNNEASQ